MSMGNSGLGLRTIWITIRAMNYGSRVFEDVQKSISNLIGAESRLNNVNKEMIKKLTEYASAGIMAGTLSMSFAGAIWNVAAASRAGAGAFAQLNQSMFLTQQAFANTFYEVLQTLHVFEIMNGSLAVLRDNKWLQYLAMGALTATVAMTALVAAVYLGGAVMSAFHIAMGVAGISIKVCAGQMYIWNGLVNIATFSVQKFLLALTAAVAIGVAVYTLLNTLHGPARQAAAAIGIVTAALLALAVAEGMVTGGLATAFQAGAIGIGLGSAGALLTGDSYPIGTRNVGRDGLAMLHKGEVVYNPATGRPNNISNEMNGGKPNVTTNTFEFHVDALNTKSDVDDVKEKISKELRNAMLSVR